MPLTGEDLKATYTITVLNKAPHEAGAEAFVTYLLGPTGRRPSSRTASPWSRPPTVTGTGVPSGLSSVLS